jgi:hypothetical protein
VRELFMRSKIPVNSLKQTKTFFFKPPRGKLSKLSVQEVENNLKLNRKEKGRERGKRKARETKKRKRETKSEIERNRVETAVHFERMHN